MQDKRRESFVEGGNEPPGPEINRKEVGRRTDAGRQDEGPEHPP